MVGSTRRGGRGARERLLAAATVLFYRDGIHATGVARLADVAQVSTRTFYQHFPSKDALVTAYLTRLDSETAVPAEAQLLREDLPPREKLLALFADRPAEGIIRGCPFHNAAVEGAGTMPEVADVVRSHKNTFRARITAVAAEAGAADPEALGRQLALLFEGARALATSLDDPAPLRDAHATAATLIDHAVS